MAGFGDQVRGWTNRQKRNALNIAREAGQDTEDMMTERTASRSFAQGKVPVDTSALINSHKPGNWAGLSLGGSVTSGFSIEYAIYVEYGTVNMQGYHFVRNAVQKWPATVAAAAVKF